MKRFRVAITALLLTVSWSAAADNNSWFEFSQEVKVSWLFKVKSAVVNYVHPDGSAEAAGIEVGDELIAVGGCEIPGCPAGKSKKLMDIPVGQVQTFKFRRSSGSEIEVELVAVKWPG